MRLLWSLDLRESLQAIQSNVAMLSLGSGEHENAIESMRSDLAALSLDANAHNSAIDSMRSDFAALQANVERQGRDLQAAIPAITEIESTVERLGAELSGFNSAIATIQTAFHDTRGKLEQALSDVAGTQLTVEQLGQQLKAACDGMATLGGAVQQHATELARSVTRLGVLEDASRDLGSALRGDWDAGQSATLTSKQYWTVHNVTMHHAFSSVEDSLRQFENRNQQYPGYIEMLPVAGKNGYSILDYGCGPGHDLVGFCHYSRPSRVVAADVSSSSIEEARQRLALHGAQAEFVTLQEDQYELPLQPASFDYIHCSGVLMYVQEPARLLKEFRRLLKPGGEVRLMVYNHDSIWMHLYVAYIVQIRNGLYGDLPTRTAFLRTTDGEECPINAVWRPGEMLELGRSAGFDPEFLGAAVSLWEMHLLPRRHMACLDPRLPEESRAFLMDLRFDDRGYPWHGDARAGIDGCYRLRPIH